MTPPAAELLDRLLDPRPAVRRAAALELSALAAHERPPAADLLAIWPQAEPEVCAALDAALEDAPPPPPAALPALAAALRSPEADVAYWAAALLGRMQTQAAPAVGDLAAALEAHLALGVRQRAAWALGQIGPAALEAAAALKRAQASADPRLARLARAALVRLECEPTSPPPVPSPSLDGQQGES